MHALIDAIAMITTRKQSYSVVFADRACGDGDCDEDNKDGGDDDHDDVVGSEVGDDDDEDGGDSRFGLHTCAGLLECLSSLWS